MSTYRAVQRSGAAVIVTGTTSALVCYLVAKHAAPSGWMFLPLAYWVALSIVVALLILPPKDGRPDWLLMPGLASFVWLALDSYQLAVGSNTGAGAGMVAFFCGVTALGAAGLVVVNHYNFHR